MKLFSSTPDARESCPGEVKGSAEDISRNWWACELQLPFLAAFLAGALTSCAFGPLPEPQKGPLGPLWLTLKESNPSHNILASTLSSEGSAVARLSISPETNRKPS